MRSRSSFELFPLNLPIKSHRLFVGLCGVTTATLLAGSLVLPPGSASGSDSTVSDFTTIAQSNLTLKETLERGLRVRRPSEFAFIGRVVEMVEDGKLPLGLVQGTFNWARKKKPYPYPYFERGLKVRAAKIGIVVE